MVFLVVEKLGMRCNWFIVIRFDIRMGCGLICYIGMYVFRGVR